MEKNRIKFEFLVHDLKVPLAVIEAGLVSLLNKKEKYGPLTDKQAKVLERARGRRGQAGRPVASQQDTGGHAIESRGCHRGGDPAGGTRTWQDRVGVAGEKNRRDRGLGIRN